MPYLSQINMSKITWQPWKSKFPPDPALASWKTYKSIFLISGLPKFAHQGCHISGGRRDRISKIIPDIGQKVNLRYPVTGIFGAFCLSFLLLKIEVWEIIVVVLETKAVKHAAECLLCITWLASVGEKFCTEQICQKRWRIGWNVNESEFLCRSLSLSL